MPLMHKKSKDTQSNGKGQSLAVAYGIKRKPKRKMYAEGEVVTGSENNDNYKGLSKPFQSQSAPSAPAANIYKSPDERITQLNAVKQNLRPLNPSEQQEYNTLMAKKNAMYDGGMVNENKDSRHQIARNAAKKALTNDSWTDNSTVKQAQKPSITKLSQPKIVKSDAFSVRNIDMRDDENDFGDRIYPETDKAQPVERDNEYGPKRSGDKVSDMERQHKAKKAPYDMAKEDQYSQDEAEDDMKKKQSPPGRYAKGGKINDDVSFSDSENDELEHPAGLEEDDDMMTMPVDEYMAGHFADGGMLDGELEEEHHDSIAAAIMSRMNRKMMAEGGKTSTSTTGNKTKTGGSNPGGASTGGAGTVTVTTRDMGDKGINISNVGGKTDSKNAGGMDPDDKEEGMMKASGGSVRRYADGGEVDLDLNAEEEPNGYYHQNEDAALKENYDEPIDSMSQPEDSNEHGDSREHDEENEHDMISQIMSKMKSRRQFKSR